jgi:hypothetical protein
MVGRSAHGSMHPCQSLTNAQSSFRRLVPEGEIPEWRARMISMRHGYFLCWSYIIHAGTTPASGMPRKNLAVSKPAAPFTAAMQQTMVPKPVMMSGKYLRRNCNDQHAPDIIIGVESPSLPFARHSLHQQVGRNELWRHSVSSYRYVVDEILASTVTIKYVIDTAQLNWMPFRWRLSVKLSDVPVCSTPTNPMLALSRYAGLCEHGLPFDESR